MQSCFNSREYLIRKPKKIPSTAHFPDFIQNSKDNSIRQSTDFFQLRSRLMINNALSNSSFQINEYSNIALCHSEIVSRQLIEICHSPQFIDINSVLVAFETTIDSLKALKTNLVNNVDTLLFLRKMKPTSDLIHYYRLQRELLYKNIVFSNKSSIGFRPIQCHSYSSVDSLKKSQLFSDQLNQLFIQKINNRFCGNNINDASIKHSSVVGLKSNTLDAFKSEMSTYDDLFQSFNSFHQNGGGSREGARN